MRRLSMILAVCCLGNEVRAAPAYPLHVAADFRHVVDHSGRDVFFNGESAWHIIVRLTREEVIQYLDDRQARGFDALLVMLVVATGAHGTSNNAYGEPPFLATGDFSRPNEAYFAHADWVLQQAEARGFTVFLAPAYLGYECGQRGWCREMKRLGVVKMRAWGRLCRRALQRPTESRLARRRRLRGWRARGAGDRRHGRVWDPGSRP